MGSEEARSAALGIGSPVWVEDVENAWIEATVVKRDGDAVTARTVHGDLVETRMANALPRDEDVTMRGVDDMTKLSYLHEPGVLHNLYARYKHDEIYTYTGNILIAVNPFTRLPHLFNTYMMKQYQDAQPGDLNPHVYSVADAAYKAMMEEMKSQSILVSGESGAGKTETTKQIMQYLAFVGGRTVGDNRSVEQQVLQSNPLLEAFGNAKTVRNNNSSRFGKFVEIQFNNGKISGAAVRTYLLERSRVTQISTPERNYHCFYQLVAGASHEDAERLKLGPPDSFHYLNQSKCVEVGAIDDCKEYQLTREAMDIVGITTEEQEAIFRTIAAVLHLGNIEFNSGESEASEVSTEKSKFHLKAAADMLMCDEEMLEKSLTTRIMKATRTESITKILNKSQATDNRDALARTIYAKLFDWLVNKVNKSIGQDPHSTVLIGVLDIYGFESFEINSFEQFCINLTNEKLQQHFNTHVFKMEQAEYRKEEINWDDIDFVDNIDVLDLIEKRPLGIIALLDEACMLPRSTAESFARKLGDTFHNHKRFSKHKFKRTAFTIDHYAGQVEYRADLFLEKNKDFVVPEHQQLLHASKCAFVSGLFPLDEGAKAPSKFMSIGSQFKLQLATLMETLKLAAPHYIRCVKPNMQLKPQIFENKNVLQQLRCSGVLEAVRISCAGFPTRRTFEEFLDRFGLLHPEVLIESADEKVACQNLLEKCNLKGYQIGKTKVFLRAGQMAILDTKRSNVLNEAAVKIQHMVQSFLMRKDYERMKSASLLVQAYWRGTMARLEFRFLREQVSAVCFQRYIRGYLAQKNYLKMQQAAIRIQSAVRSLAARRFLCFLEDNHAATQIQSKWRSYVAFRSYDELLRSCIVFQGAWRCKEARSEIKKLRQAARETGALREAKNRLEKKCEELTLRLGLAKVSLIARNSELAKLQSAMEEAKAQVEQMKMLVAKERKGHEADLAQAKVAAAQLLDAKMSAQPSKEVLDKIEALSEENTKLKKLVEDYEKKKALAESSAKRIEEADLKRDAMQELLSRSEEQVQNLISENQSLQSEKENLQSENRILRQQALNMKDLESENQDLQRNLTHLETNSQALRAENETLKQQLEQLTSKGGTAVKIGQPAVTPIKPTPEPVITTSYPDEQPTTPGVTGPGTPSRPLGRSQHIRRESSDYMSLYLPEDSPVPEAKPVDQKKSKMMPDKLQSDQEALFDCLMQDVGFSKDHPVAAVIIFKCLLQWHSFEAERTNVFDRIINAIQTAIESHSDNNDVLAYWLSNTSTLLHLLQRTLKAGGGGGTTPQRRRQTTLFGRMTQRFSSQQQNYPNGTGPIGLDNVRQVEAKYPALLFKQQLTAYVEKIYGMLRDNLKKEITPLLGSCIQAPRAPRHQLGRKVSLAPGQQVLSSHWGSIINSLLKLLNILRGNKVPPYLVRKTFTQIFSFINVQLLNSLLLRRECCSFSNGEYIKAGLAQLEHWIYEAGEEYAGASWEELRYIRQAVGFLVIHQKPKKSLDEIMHDLCPALSIQQLYRISTMYWDDKYGTHTVAPEVIQNMRILMTEDSNNAVSNSFLLDDDSGIPFSVDDISKSMPEVDLSEVHPPPLLKGMPSFRFLQPEKA
nr:TPA: myosin XI subclass 2 isoform 2 [Chara braunii]